MSWGEIALVVAALLVVAYLLHASNVISRNPYLRIKMHEDAGVKLPKSMSWAEKQDFLDRRGIAPRGFRQPLVWILVVLLMAVLSVLSHYY